ncbi:MAG TPA: signal peptide peptidase SppA [Candidatus Amulumruptor caecigallinarius]|uniref:Signal peptide peptidase SppA n=1 Tax=Candidatus Amulumruptor caecigallinarius TaxID=2109911 RepID=A0A921JII1_9BACT|nr:signal peptide peptidase SppA [Candidatus Amulumruptor caecigallinarius]
MRKFFIAFLGSMAALWITGILIVLGTVVLVIAVSSSSVSKDYANMETKVHSVLHLSLDVDLVEHNSDRPSLTDIITDDIKAPLPLAKAIKAIEEAANDGNIDGMFIEARDGDFGTAQADALARAIKKFKKSGKWVYAYGDSYSQSEYYIASAADSLFLNPVGAIDIHGIGAATFYGKDFLDKVGVSVTVVKVGTYKSAVEPFILNGMSDAAREQNAQFLGSMWGYMRKNIADNRQVTAAKVNQWADSLLLFQDPQFLLREKVVDRLAYRHEINTLIADLTDCEKAADINWVGVEQYAATKTVKDATQPKNKKQHVAVLYAEGDISDSGTSGISAESLVPEIEAIMNDDNVAGLILRVDSPGGSAFASEQIWEALDQFKKVTGKPFYVSMGNYAASGGYYISCGADKIYAEPLTITGSIGIFGMIPNAAELFNDKLGIHFDQYLTNPQGELFNLFAKPSARSVAALQRNVDRGYALFTKRCSEGRNMPMDKLLTIAEGRVWDGMTALKLGLVDKLGGLDAAVADMTKQLGMSRTDVVEYPKSEYDLLYDLLRLRNVVEERITMHQLGAAYPMWKEMRQISEMEPVQARAMTSVDF